ncbi:hypothetical protein SDC9_195561 [bioreactor metagenome]|uniref:Uncharacterized protein n=1 Tax=bioreactor metagenome TaxID=1076179 RepID=A0A645I9D7_9ZZZZ|nr:hypothetical protein [Candidatus Fimivivens sp.]
MNKLIEKLTNLINVKTLVTFAVTFVFVYLAVRGSISAETAMTIVTMVIGFYFGTQHEQNSGGK